MPVLGLYGAAITVDRWVAADCRMFAVERGRSAYRSRPPCGAGEACSVVRSGVLVGVGHLRGVTRRARIIARAADVDALRVQVLVVSAAEGGQVRGAAPILRLVGAAALVLE